MVKDNHIEFVLSKLVDYFSPREVYLFGSQARGEANSDSDIDLLIVKESDQPRHKRALGFRKELREQYVYPLDILIYTPQEFEIERTIKGTIPYQVAKEGKLIYGSQSQSTGKRMV